MIRFRKVSPKVEKLPERPIPLKPVIIPRQYCTLCLCSWRQRVENMKLCPYCMEPNNNTIKPFPVWR